MGVVVDGSADVADFELYLEGCSVDLVRVRSPHLYDSRLRVRARPEPRACRQLSCRSEGPPRRVGCLLNSPKQPDAEPIVRCDRSGVQGAPSVPEGGATPCR